MNELVARLQLVPYREGGGSWAGADCWGIVELWYREWLGIELPNRASIAPGPAGLQAGFDAAENFEAIDRPENHCLAVMRSGRLQAGHVGVVWNGGVVHSERGIGCIHQPLGSRFVAPRITCFLRYRRK